MRRCLASELLGSHVERAAEQRSGRGQADRAVLDLDDSEVADLDGAVVEQHEVGRLDVAVHDVPRVGGGQPVAHLGAVLQHLLRGKPAGVVLVQDRREITPFQELQDEERGDFHLPIGAHLLVLAQVVDDGDVAVVQPGGRLAFTAEACQDLGGEPVVTQM